MKTLVLLSLMCFFTNSSYAYYQVFGLEHLNAAFEESNNERKMLLDKMKNAHLEYKQLRAQIKKGENVTEALKKQNEILIQNNFLLPLLEAATTATNNLRWYKNMAERQCLPDRTNFNDLMILNIKQLDQMYVFSRKIACTQHKLTFEYEGHSYSTVTGLIIPAQKSLSQ